MIAVLTRNATPVISVSNSTWLTRGSSNTKQMTSDTNTVRTSRYLGTDMYVLRVQKSYRYFPGRRNKWSRFRFIPTRWIRSSFNAVSLKISKSLHRPYKQLHASATSDTILTCMSDYRRGLDWLLDLLHTLTRDLWLHFTVHCYTYNTYTYTSVLSLLQFPIVAAW
jgi:hypothetical protein